jgi:hypothetical protein
MTAVSMARRPTGIPVFGAEAVAASPHPSLPLFLILLLSLQVPLVMRCVAAV